MSLAAGGAEVESRLLRGDGFRQWDHSKAAGSCGGQIGQRSSVLLGFLLPLAAAHCSDESSSFSTAVFRQQEVNKIGRAHV